MQAWQETQQAHTPKPAFDLARWKERDYAETARWEQQKKQQELRDGLMAYYLGRKAGEAASAEEAVELAKQFLKKWLSLEEQMWKMGLMLTLPEPTQMMERWHIHCSQTHRPFRQRRRNARAGQAEKLPVRGSHPRLYARCGMRGVQGIRKGADAPGLSGGEEIMTAKAVMTMVDRKIVP